MNNTIKFVAELSHVREISLLGTADADFWRARLSDTGLTLDENDGKAQFLISASDARFKGIRFRELSFSVLVSHSENSNEHSGAYLLRAYNSCRFFAFCERVFFSTPYYHGNVAVTIPTPAIQLTQRGETAFRAGMHTDASSSREASRQGNDGWSGPVFLPQHPRREDSPPRLFFARIQGHTLTYPFQQNLDQITIKPTRECAILQALVDSNFNGKEWSIRADAMHAKSKTYLRSEAVKTVWRG